MVIMIMGVSGCGKTTLGEKTAARLGLPYHEADSFHPEVNIRKMSDGIPLTDEDRWPWLAAIRESIKGIQGKGDSAVFTCSALKESYRRYLEEGLEEPLKWVYLRGTFETIHDRMAARKGHYFKADMLKSQFAALEEPDYGIILDIEEPLEEKVETLVRAFG